MERIQELLNKGIDSLTDDELAELRSLIADEAAERFDDDSDDALVELEQLAGYLDQVKDEEQKRVDAAEARAAKRAELADRIKGVTEPEPEADVEPEADAEVEVDAEVETPDVEAEAAPEAEPELIAAANAPAVTASAPVISRVAARRPAAHAPRKSSVRQASLVASANVPGTQAGKRLDTNDSVHAAFQAASDIVMSARRPMKMPVAQLRADIAPELMLGRDPYLNEQKLAARTSPEALVASGGICAPVPYRYDLPTVGDNARPVREALARFGAERGGIRTLTPPTISDVSGAIGQWTVTNDEDPQDPTTKPYLTIDCDDTETTTKVYAITRSFKVGNFMDRWSPERVQAFLSLTNTYQARYAEAKLLAGITAGSKVVTHGQLLGTAQDIFTALDQLFVGIRYRHRIGRGQTFRVIGFEWVRENIIADLIRKGPGDRTLEERLVMAETEVDAFFRARGANIAWSPDYEYGVALGQPGGPLAGVQGVGPVIGYPSKARFYVHMEGSWLFLDGGQLDLGVIRDQTLVGTNDMLLFAETFENVHYHGVPNESYVYDIDICANGGIASALDIDPCVSGS